MSGILLAIMTLGLVASCDDDEEVIIIIDRDLSEADAQELVANILSYDTYGLVAQFERIGDEILDTAECGQPVTDSDTENGGNGNYSYVYTFTETFSLQCEPNLVLDYDLEGSQDIDALNYESEHGITLGFATTGLETDAPEEIYDGVYDRSGEWEGDRVGETFDFTYDSTVDGIRVDKTTRKIVSGSSDFVLVQTYSRDNLSYTYSGTVTFLGDDRAEVTYSDGQTYIVELGDVSIPD